MSSLFDDVRLCTLTQDMVPAEGIVDFVYPLMGSVLKGIQLGAVRCAGVGDDYAKLDRVPPLSAVEMDAFEETYLSIQPECIYRIDTIMAAHNWIQASLIDDGSPAYKRVMDILNATDRTLGTQRMALMGAL